MQICKWGMGGLPCGRRQAVCMDTAHDEASPIYVPAHIHTELGIM